MDTNMKHHHPDNGRNMHAAATPRSGRQHGFTLIEVALAITLVLIIGIASFPAVKGFIIQGRVPAAAGELQRFMSTTRVLGESDSVTPYAALGNAENLAPSLRDSTVFKVNGSTVAHRLGGSGVGSNGTITIAPAALGGGAVGSAFSLTLTSVNHKACPVLASTLNGISEMMSVNGTAAKTLGANNEAGSFNPVTAQNLCVNGDNNTFVFATR
jgi:prepilin-type N-terminal cleavage/methylation domain-containing protein